MRDFNAWILGLLGALVALLGGTAILYIFRNGPDLGIVLALFWQSILALNVVIGGVVVCPIFFFVAERLGIARQSKKILWWIALLLGCAFAAIFQLALAAGSPTAYVVVVIVGIALNTAVFGAVYSRPNFKCNGPPSASVDY